MNNKMLVTLVVFFLCKSFTLTAGNTWGRTPHIEQQEDPGHGFNAALEGDVATLERMICSGVKVEEMKNDWDMPALEAAIYQQQTESVRCLLEHRASVIEEDGIGRTPVMLAVGNIQDCQHSTDILHLLLRHHPARDSLFDNRWVQWLVHLQDPQVEILVDAIDHVENNKKYSTVAQSVLAHQFPVPVLAIVRSFLSKRQETPAESAQTLTNLHSQDQNSVTERARTVQPRQALKKKSSKTRRTK